MTDRVKTAQDSHKKANRLETERLRKITEVARLLTASLETTTVVQTIIESIPQVIPAVEACVLMLYDPTIERLVARASVGFITETLKLLQLKPGESMSGYVFLHNHPVLYAGDINIQQGIDTMTPYNRILQTQLTPLQAKSVMCAPLDFKGRALGVITVNNFHATDAFTEFDLELLQSLASQASISIENSRLYERQRQSLIELAQLNQIISQQHQQLQHALHIHRTLSGLALQNRGLAAITQALADILGQPVAVLDLLLNILAQAHPSEDTMAVNDNILPPQEWGQQVEKLRISLRNESEIALLVEQNYNNEGKKKVVPIQAGNDKLGYILTARSSSGPRDDFAEVAIEQAATIIALELVKEQAVFEVERRLRGEFLEEILTDKLDENIVNRATLLGYDSNCLYWIILADIDDFRGYIQKNCLQESTIAAFKRQLLKFITKLVTRHYPKSIVTVRSDMVVIMLGTPVGPTQELLRERAYRMILEIKTQLAQEFNEISFSLAISRPCSELGQFRLRYQEALLSLQIMGGAANPGKVVDCSSLGSALLLLKVEDKGELLEFVEAVLGNLIKYDRQHQSNLINTLQTYSKCNSDHQLTTSELHIHPNTLSYRLGRIEEIIGRSLNRTDDWLDIQLALRLFLVYPGYVHSG